VEHARYADPDAFFNALAARCTDPETDFVDGVAFEPSTC